MSTNKVIWGIHAGNTGDADFLFKEKSLIAIGWPALGELSLLTENRESLKEEIARKYPGKKAGAIPVIAGQLIRFATDMKVGDLVVYPSKSDRQLHIGEIIGNYEHRPDVDSRYPNQRKVKWLKAVPRTRFTQGALHELGSAMTLFQMKNYANEIYQVLSIEHSETPTDEADQETVKVVAEEIRENTQDYVLKVLERELKGHPLADFVAQLLQTMGFQTRVSPPGADGGIDILAHRDELGFEPPIIKVQVKSSTEKVSDGTVKSLFGNVDQNEHGLFVTLGYYSSQARQFERTKSNLRLIDGVQLVELVLRHYEDFDAFYKGLIPLKRVYVPQPVEDDSE